MASVRGMLQSTYRAGKVRILYPLLLCSLVASLSALLACTSPSASPSVSATTGAAAPVSFQTLAAKGRSIYASSCASCHGERGQGGIGPALWGPGVTLGTYEGITFFNNAGDMLNRFMPAMMPLSAKGSLSLSEYEDVLSYILLEDNQVSPTKIFDANQLDTIRFGPYVPPAGLASLAPVPTSAPNQAKVTIDLAARDNAFSLSTMTVPAGAEVTIDFDNQDAGTAHNFSVYRGESESTGMVTEPIFIGAIITGPARTIYTFTAPTTPGTYFFRCDVHPSTMIGIFVVK